MNKRQRKKYFKKLGVWGKGYDAVVTCVPDWPHCYHYFKVHTPVKIASRPKPHYCQFKDAEGKDQCLFNHDVMMIR